MEIRIDSNFLNNVASLLYGDIIPIFLENNSNNVVGRCQIFLDKISGHYYADLNLEDEKSIDLYVYYMSSFNSKGYCEIDNLSLHSKQRNDKPSKKLKDLIVKKEKQE